MLDLKLKNKKLFYGTISILFAFFLFPGQAQAANCDCTFEAHSGLCTARVTKTYAIEPGIDVPPITIIQYALENYLPRCTIDAAMLGAFTTSLTSVPNAGNINASNCAAYSLVNNLPFTAGTITIDDYSVICLANVSSVPGTTAEGEENMVTCPKSGLKVSNLGLCLRAELAGLNQLPGVTAPILIGRVMRTAMGVIGSIALVMLTAGGLMWMTARGNSERVSAAMRTITWATLGIIVILSSYIIVKFIFDIF